MEQQVIPSDYTQYAEAVEIIKHAIERCRYRSAAAVNKETLSLYFGVGNSCLKIPASAVGVLKHCLPYQSSFNGSCPVCTAFLNRG